MSTRPLLHTMGFVKPPKPEFLFRHPVKGVAEYADYRVAKRVAHRRKAATLAALGAAALTAAAAPFAWKKLHH